MSLKRKKKYLKFYSSNNKHFIKSQLPAVYCYQFSLHAGSHVGVLPHHSFFWAQSPALHHQQLLMKKVIEHPAAILLNCSRDTCYYSQKLDRNVNFIYCKNHSHNKIPASSTSPPQIILKTSAAFLNVSRILTNTGEGEKYCWLQSHLLRQRANAQNISFVTLNSGQIVLSTQLIIILNYPVFGMCSF